VEKQNITLDDLFLIWNEERRQDSDLALDTVDKDLKLYRKYLQGSSLSKKKMKTISIDDLHFFFKEITTGRKMSKSGFNNLKSMLNLLFDFGVQEYRVIEHNIARELKANQYKFAPKSNKINDVFTTEEIKRLWKYMIEKDTVYSLACALSFNLGCRIGELKALRWTDIDWDRQTIYIHSEVVTTGRYANQQEVKTHTKSGLTEGAREIPLFADGLFTLQRIKDKKCGNEEFLFLGKTGKFLLTQEFNDTLKEACTSLGISYLSSHKARKWAATEALRNGMDEVTLMYTFGWKSMETVRHYIKPQRTKQAQLNVLAKVFEKTNIDN